MITNNEYQKKTLTYWYQKKVRAVQQLQNGNIIAPVGTVFSIINKSSGFTVVGEKCSCCGISPIFARVDPRKLELVDDLQVVPL